jgi:NAD(P)H dehydrogenase (quinone)
MTKVLIVYFSKSGNTKKMALAVARGVRIEGAKVDVKAVKNVQPKDLLKYDALIFGSPTYYGLMAAELKKLLDVSVKYHGRLTGKVAGAFTSCGGIAGGAETTLLSILAAFLIHGMVAVGDANAYHYGPVSIGAPNKAIELACVNYGRKLARLAKKLFS